MILLVHDLGGTWLVTNKTNIRLPKMFNSFQLFNYW